MDFARHLAHVARRVGRHDSVGRGAQLALFALLALFPLMLALVSLLSVLHLGSQVEVLGAFVERGLPPGQAAMVISEIERLGARSGWPLLISVLLSAYYAGNGAAAVIRGVSVGWDRHHVHVWKTQLAGTALAAGVLLFAVLIFALLMLANLAIGWARARGVLPGSLAFLSLVRWPVLILTFHACVRLTFGLGAGPEWHGGWFSWGSVVATLAWLFLSQGFEAYLGAVTDLGAMYGSLGGTVGLLLYFHLVATFVFVGAEIDAYRQRGPLTGPVVHASDEADE